MILYFCDDSTLKSAGLRILYRHVEILTQHGFAAAILHEKPGFRMADMPEVPIRASQSPGAISPGDVVVVPEVFPKVYTLLQSFPVRRMIIALNWRFIYQWLPEGTDYKTLGIERVLTQSPFIADFVQWSMRLPADVFTWGIRETLYYPDPAKKIPQVVYIQRKQEEMRELMAVLRSRNRELVTRIKWIGLEGLDEAAYAEEIRRSMLFINISRAEGLPCSALEAMRAGTLVAGFNSVGGQRELVGEGPAQNCVLAENLDYVTLAMRLEPLLADILAGNMERWEMVRQNGFAASSPFTREAEEASVLEMWRKLLPRP